MSQLVKAYRCSSTGLREAWSLVALGCLLLTLLPASPAGAQEHFSELRQSVRAPDVPDPDPPQHEARRRSRSSASDDPCDDEDDFWGALLAPFLAPVALVAAAGVTSPFWGPAQLIGDSYDQPGYFPGYPYQDQVEGYMMRDTELPVFPRPWSVRLRGDYADDFHDLSSIGGHVLWETTRRWGADAEFRFREEDLGPGRSDELWTGDANLLFRFAQSPRLQMRAGVGVNWLADEQEKDFGINFTYGGDWYPARPLVISAELDLGRLGRATYFHGRVTAGVVVRRYELFTGYDYYDVGDAQIQGLVGGLRIWF